MNKSLKWTKPYFGVSHLDFWPDKMNYQITLTEYSCFTEGYILFLKSNTPFTPIFEIMGDLDFVKKEPEKKTKQIGIY